MIKKKRKIKVQAAKTGLIASNSEMAGINGYQTKNYPVPSISQKSIDALSPDPEVPSATNVTGQIVGVAKGLGNLASIGSAAANQQIGTGQAAISGLGAGASAGAAFGPVGAGIGAAVGAVTGVLSSGLSGGRDAQMTSFTDYDEGELAGFLRPGKRRKQRRLREKMKVNAYSNRAAVAGTERLQNEWAEDFGDMDTNTFAYGGLTNALAYVDDGELIQTPDGTVSKVPEQGKPTDSNLVSLPEGSKILSDSLKVPGTKKTFAQVGEEMMATKKSKFNDIYAQNAAKLNEMNNKSIHDQLFEMQEAVKAKKGIKRKYKNAAIAAAGGDKIPPQYVFQLDKDYAVNDTIEYGGRSYRVVRPYNARGTQYNYVVEPFTADTEYGEGINIYKPKRPKLDPATNLYPQPVGGIGTDNTLSVVPSKVQHRPQVDRMQQLLNLLPEVVITPDNEPVYNGGTLPEVTATGYRRQKYSGINLPEIVVTPDKESIYDGGNLPELVVTPNTKRSSKRTVKKTTSNKLRLTPADWINPANDVPIEPYSWIDPANDTPVEGELDILRNTPQPSKKTDKPKDDKGKGDKGKGTSFDPAWLDTISSIGSTIGGLMPIIANLREKPEYQRPVYNPFMGEALRTMRRRRYDINPAIRDIERNRAITNYNADQMNTNTGANLAFRLQNAVNTNRAIADLRSTESNVNNAYLGEYAQMAANLGEQWAAESRRVDEANIASRAQARNIRRAGLSGVSQYLQNNEFMRNQRNRDNMMMALYDPFLEAGFTTQDLTNFRNWLRRTNG